MNKPKITIDTNEYSNDISQQTTNVSNSNTNQNLQLLSLTRPKTLNNNQTTNKYYDYNLKSPLS